MSTKIDQRYVEAMTWAIRRGLTSFTVQPPTPGVESIEQAIVFPRALIEGNAAIALPGDNAVVDRAGHMRPVYRPLLIYALRQAFELIRPSLSTVDVRRWEDGLVPRERALVILLESANPAAAAWAALAIYAGGESGQAEPVMGRVISTQKSNGSFLPLAPLENPETNWYDELVLLHAMASYAARSRASDAIDAVQRAAAYHMEETQPDHATSQPWGVLAFLLNPQTLPLADQVLHAAEMQHPNGLDAISMILLADAVVGLRGILGE